mmetsp:Transcript_40097/g.79819  ORF Transcript_40097/g.79819 Transcript_40097/m.79819 type:complete len:214 (+) Transcript_40097:3-644(+)
MLHSWIPTFIPPMRLLVLRACPSESAKRVRRPAPEGSPAVFSMLVRLVDRGRALHHSDEDVGAGRRALHRVLGAGGEEAEVEALARRQDLVDVLVTIVLAEVGPVPDEDGRRLRHVAGVQVPHGADLVVDELPSPLLAVGGHAEDALVGVQLALPIDGGRLKTMLHRRRLQRATGQLAITRPGALHRRQRTPALLRVNCTGVRGQTGRLGKEP